MRRCGRCKEQGHNRRSCPGPARTPLEIETKTPDTRIVIVRSGKPDLLLASAAIESTLLRDAPKGWAVSTASNVEMGVQTALAVSAQHVIFVTDTGAAKDALRPYVERIRLFLPDCQIVISDAQEHAGRRREDLDASGADLFLHASASQDTWTESLDEWEPKHERMPDVAVPWGATIVSLNN